MKKQIVTLALFLILSASISVHAAILGEIHYSSGVGGGYRGIADSLHFTWIYEFLMEDELRFNLFEPFFLSDIGNTQTTSSTTPSFDTFASLLTNGNDDHFDHWLLSSGPGKRESNWINKFVESYGPDFFGYEITDISLTLNDASLISPGRNPNGDGLWTDYSYDVTYSFYGEPIPEPANLPPVADAGDDQIVYLCSEDLADIELDGSGSTDADGDELTYLWTWTIDANEMTATGVDPNIMLPVGLHTINLTVDDGVEESEPNSCVIEVIEGIEVDLRVMPRVINRKSRMKRILAVVQLPAGIDGDDIDGSFWLYPGEIEPRFRRLMTVNGSQKLFMVFDKSELLAAVPGNGAVVLEIEAQLISGRCLYGSDRIRIIRRGRGPREQTGLRKGTRFRRNRVQNSR